MLLQAAITLTVALSAVSAAAASLDKRIVGGEDAKDGEFPFLVSITGTKGICGGTLLDGTTVLTAAHCIWGTVSVRAGSLQHRSGGVESKIVSRTAHPDYQLNRKDKTKPYANNDIAILKLATPIEESDKIRYATLAANGSDAVPGSTATVAGWGIQKPKRRFIGDATENMAKVNISVHAREVCAKLDPDVKDRDTVLCAGGDGKNGCKYDSGGPLIDQATGQVIGISSWTIADEEGLMCNKAPMVFTRVGSYISFIEEGLKAKPDSTPAMPTTTPTEANKPVAEPSMPTNDQGPKAKEDELCSTAAGSNKYKVSEDDCRRMVGQCVHEEGQKNAVVENFDGVIKCMDTKFRL